MVGFGEEVVFFFYGDWISDERNEIKCSVMGSLNDLWDDSPLLFKTI